MKILKPEDYHCGAYEPMQHEGKRIIKIEFFASMDFFKDNKDKIMDVIDKANEDLYPPGHDCDDDYDCTYCDLWWCCKRGA